ncbi:MAG: glycosyltransferase, partial [Actinobacteria bacterium]|nr:glycosyltransferase [Actinomycetota bacterium]
VAAFPVEGMPAYGMGFKPAAGPMGRARDRMGRMMFERMMDRPLLEPLNAVRAQLQLAPVESVFDWVLNHDPLLVLTSETFDFPARFPDTVCYVGPQLEEPEWCPVWEPPWEEADDRPLVVVGLSTTYQAHEDLLENVVEALGQLPVKALVTTGNLELLSRVPANVHTEPFVPHARVLPLADLVITHAGHGTTIAALAHGIPLVCLPLGRDQPDIAARVRWHGAGVKLSPKSKPPKIAAAVHQVLEDSSYRRAANRLAQAIAAEEPKRRGVEELERLVSRRGNNRHSTDTAARGSSGIGPVRGSV